jgi:hypothetical protein
VGGFAGKGEVNVLLGDGKGGFQPDGPYVTGTTRPFYATAADFSKDGLPDVVVTNDTESPISFLLNVSSIPPYQVQSVVINDGSTQRSNINHLTVTFDQTVTFKGAPADAFRLDGDFVGSVPLMVEPLSGPGPTAVSITFDPNGTNNGYLADDNYTLTVLSDQINGGLVGGTDYHFPFHRYFGDFDGDRDVDAADFAGFRGGFGQPAGNSLNFAFDADHDGDVDALDFAAFRSHFGTALP